MSPKQPERFGAMRVQQLRHAHVLLTHKTANARQRQLQLVRRGRLRDEQTMLKTPRLNRTERHVHRGHGRLWRMRLQIHLQQLQQSTAIAHGHRQMQYALVLAAVVERQRHANFVGCQAVCGQPVALVIQYACQQKQQRFQQLDGMVERDALRINFRRLVDLQRLLDGPSREAL
jgi:hypothetical protein